MEAFTVKDITRGTSTSQQLLNEWMKHNVFTPSILVSRGRGNANIFSEDDLVYVVLLKMLLSLGLKYRDINEAYLRDTLTRYTEYRVVRWNCESRFSSLHVVHVTRGIFGIDPHEHRRSTLALMPITWVQL